MFPTIRLGNLAIQAPGLLIILGIYLGISLAEKRLSRQDLTVNQFYGIIFLGLGIGILGARVVFILENFKQFLASPINVVSLDSSLMDPFAGLVMAGISILIYGYRKKLNFWKTMDALSPALAVFSVFLGLSHLASGKAFGIPTYSRWGIYLWGENRIPSQLYETFAVLMILVLLWNQFKQQDRPGKTFLLLLTSTAGVHLFLEAWRGDVVPMILGIRLSQLVAWIVLATGLLILDKRVTRLPRNGE